MNRREVLRDGSMLLLAASTPAGAAPPEKPAATLGLVTDVHFAEADPAGTRFYRESLGKLEEAATLFRERRVDAAIEMGDLIDSAPGATAETELGFLAKIEAVFSQSANRRHYVLGNHCVTTLTKAQFLGAVQREKSAYSFDLGGVHFVILDACHRHDGVPYGNHNFSWDKCEIPAEQREWLKSDLKSTPHKTLVFVHQRLDLPVGNSFAVQSSPAVRKILEESGKVTAVLMGHSHKNELAEINGIHYAVLAAVVEGSGAANSGYSVLSAYADGSIKLEGFRRHAEHPLCRKP